MPLLLPTLLLLLTAALPTSTQDPDQLTLDVSKEDTQPLFPDADPTANPEALLEEEERQIQEEQTHEVPQYLLEEYMTLTEIDVYEEREQENVILELQPGQSAYFKWTPGTGEFNIRAIAFVVSEEGYGEQHQASEEDFIQVLAAPDHHVMPVLLGKVYSHRILKAKIVKESLIHLENKASMTLGLALSLPQAATTLQSPVKDSHFQEAVKATQGIMTFVRNLERLRQIQAGGQETSMLHRLHHDAALLSMTGVESFLILLSAFVQIYMIKSLLDNRTVV